MLACIAVCSASIACANTHEEAPAQGLTAEMAAEIEGICGLPAGALSGQAPVSDAMPKIGCAVAEARKRNVAIGFISNPADPDS
jgi:hypothetical protein